MSLKYVYIRLISTIFFSKKFKKKKKALFTINNITLKKIKKKYTRRFYRRVLFKRYDRKIKTKKFKINNWAQSTWWSNSVKIRFNIKSLFHIKTIFNIKEFLLYDYYNYHSNIIRYNNNKKLYFRRHMAKKPWKKINFFYYIKNSIDVFRLHTAKFFNFKHRTTIKFTIFLKSFFSMTTTSYIWFFEYSLPYFCVKCRFASSMGQSLSYLMNSIYYVNSAPVYHRWSILRPGDVLQSIFSVFGLLKFKFMIFRSLSFFKYTKKFLRKSIFRSRKRRVKIPNILKKGVWFNSIKSLNFRLFEADYKTFTIVLLPYTNTSIYLKYITLLWINFWNFKVSNWKYDT